MIRIRNDSPGRRCNWLLVAVSENLKEQHHNAVERSESQPPLTRNCFNPHFPITEVIAYEDHSIRPEEAKYAEGPGE
jgi:hypothetical protein